MQQIPRFRRGFRFQWEPAQNCFVLLYPEGMVRLNASAAAILGAIDGHRDLTAITASLQQQFPDVPELEADVRGFLEEAGRRHWIEWV